MPDLSTLSASQLASLAEQAKKMRAKKAGGGSGRRPGRPRKYTEPMLDSSITVEKRDWDLLKVAAADAGMSLTAYYQKLIRDDLVKKGYRSP
jgi:hypothetical protein